jgi:hypothetical protein
MDLARKIVKDKNIKQNINKKKITGEEQYSDGSSSSFEEYEV